MRRLRALLFLPLLILAGCWTGGDFYRASDLVAPIPVGDYHSDGGGHPVDVRVMHLPNGLTRFAGAGNDHPLDAGFAPLDADRHWFVMWFLGPDGEGPSDGKWLYLLLEARPQGRFRMYMPDCSRDRADAVAAGATVLREINPECHFPDRASLEAALRAYTRHPGEAGELAPIHHG